MASGHSCPIDSSIYSHGRYLLRYGKYLFRYGNQIRIRMLKEADFQPETVEIFSGNAVFLFVFLRICSSAFGANFIFVNFICHYFIF